MMEFIGSLLKGIQVPLLVLALVGIRARMKEGKWNSFDSLLLGGFLVFEFLAAFQVFFFYGELKVSSRYLLTGIILNMPFAAMGVRCVAGFFRKERFFLQGVFLAAALYILYGVTITYTPIIKDFTSAKEITRRKLTLQAARIIRQDWKGRKTAPVRKMKYDQYQSGRRPLVASTYSRVGYFAGGQNMKPFLQKEKIFPDYIVLEKEFHFAGYRKLKCISWGGKSLVIYKKSK